MSKSWVAVSLLVVACGSKVIAESSNHEGGGGKSEQEAGVGGWQDVPAEGAGGAVGTGGKSFPGTGGIRGDGGSTGSTGGRLIDPGCPSIACGSVATIRVPLLTDYPRVRSGTIRACRNGVCATLAPAVLPATPPPRGGGSTTLLAPTGGDRSEITVWTLDRGIAIVAEWLEVSQPKNGDLYRVDIDVDAMSASVTRKATYTTRGLTDFCGPVCNQASFGQPGIDCCPVSPAPDPSMYLGGSAGPDDKCVVTYDFWCTDNFRIEQDSNGCDTWQYDEHGPRPGEDPFCIPSRDAGPHVDAGTD